MPTGPLLPMLPLLDDEVINLASARRAGRTPPASDAIGQLAQAWDELFAQSKDRGTDRVMFDLDWRKHAVLKRTSAQVDKLVRGGENGDPDGPGLTRLLHGLGPRDWPQGQDARAVLWNTVVMTWRSANVPPMTDAQRRTIVDAFLESGLNPNAGGVGMAAPLYLAVSQRDLPLVQRLVERGGDVHLFHQRHAVSVSLLSLAAERNDPAMCAWLLDQGVPVSVPGAVVPQPLDVARKHEAWAAFQVLEQAALRAGLPAPERTPPGPETARFRRRL